MVILGGGAVSYKRGTPVFQDKSEVLTPLTEELVAGVGAGVHAPCHEPSRRDQIDCFKTSDLS